MIFNVGDKKRRNVLVSTDQGLMIVNRWDGDTNGTGHGHWLLDHGNANTTEVAACYQALQGIDNPRIFDIGANIGTFTTWIAMAFPQGRVYSFEPQRAVFQQLTGNVAINNLYNVYTYNMGLGDKNEYVQFAEPDYFYNCDFGTFTLKTNKHVARTADTVTVEIRTLDSFIELYQIDRADLIKIDVEGMDVEVLRGARETIKKFRPVVFVEYSDGLGSIQDSVLAELEQYGYDCQVVGNNILAK